MIVTGAPEPIGSLILEAEQKAKKKANGHTAVATDCTCEVEVAFFTPHSHRMKISRCADHRLERDEPGKAKKRRKVEVEV